MLKIKQWLLNYQEKKWLQEKDFLIKKIQLLKEQELIKNKNKKKIPTSKKLIWFLFINCTLIEIVVIYVTFESLTLAKITAIIPDFSPLVTLVGTIASEVIGYAVYALKSAKENTSGGITYEMAMQNFSQNNIG